MNAQAPVQPRVSVVIPTYGRGELLCRAVKSVQAQTYRNWELIVVDDATPGSEVTDAIRGFDDPRLHLIRHASNLGAPAARNTGIRAARGEFIALLDSDDEWLPEKLALQMERFESDKTGSLGVVLCNVTMITQEAGGLTRCRHGSSRKFSGNVYHTLLGRRDMRPTSTLLLRRSALDPERLFDESLESSQEYDLLLRLSRKCLFETVQERLVLMHLHGGSRISTSSRRMPGMEQCMAKHRAELEACPAALSSHHAVLALRYCKTGLLDVRKARRHLKAAIRATPWMPGPWAWFMAFLISPNLFRRVKFAWPKDLPFGAWSRLEGR